MAHKPRIETWRVVCRGHRTFTMHIAEDDQRPLAECARTAADKPDLDIVRFEPVNAAAKEVVR